MVLVRRVMRKQAPNPQIVGMENAAAVHFKLPVSLRMVSRVVEQGQCIREKTAVQRAVVQVQPFALRTSFRAAKFSYPSRLPWDK